MQDNQRLGQMPISKLLYSMAVPTLLAQLVNLLYNVVDRMYVGRIEGSGSLALAGLGVSFPIIMLISAFASLVGMGGAPRAAIAMGDRDQERAEKLLGNSITLLVGFAALLFTVFYVTKDAILLAFGASEESLPYGSEYLSIYLLGTLFVMLAFGLNMFITNQGFTKISMLTVVIGCVLNIILDPVFIFALKMGVRGAAVATVISQGVSAVFVVCFLLSKKSVLKIRLKNLALSWEIVGSILSLGCSAFIMQATECLIQLVFNSGMKKYGNDDYVALMAIFFSVLQIVSMPMMGFAQGAQPIMGYNYGAKKYSRVRETFRRLFTVTTTFSFVIVLAAELFPRAFIGLFTDDARLIALGVGPLRIFLAGMAIFGAQSACQQTFLALGEAKVSMMIAMLRKVILLTPLALILPAVSGLGVTGLLLAEPVSDTISVVTTVCVFMACRRRLCFFEPDAPESGTQA